MDWVTIRMIVGNRYRKRKNCKDNYKHEWDAFVSLEAGNEIAEPKEAFYKLIDDVTFRLPNAGLERIRSEPGANEISLKFFSDGCFVLPVRITMNRALGVKKVIQEHLHIF